MAMTVTPLYSRDRTQQRDRPPTRRRANRDRPGPADAWEIIEALRQLAERLEVTLAVPPTGPRAVPDRGGILVRPDMRSVVVDGADVGLTRVEFDLLLFLADNPRRVFTRAHLLRSVWGHEHAGVRTVDVHIRRLRSKLGDHVVTTVRGVGYRLADEANATVLRLP
jgi:two-component system, OmpR family, response regulator